MSWEDDDFDVIALMNATQKETQNEIQKKQLEERKLVEESDVKLSEELFSKTEYIKSFEYSGVDLKDIIEPPA